MNQELCALFEEDRADAQTFRGAEAFIASQARRGRAQALLDAGQVRTADDYFHAAFLFQHGERLEHWAQAHLLARTAADLGEPRARYLAAAAHDRWLMRQGRAQKYGTQSIGDGTQMRLWDTDPATSDAERAVRDVPSLAELMARTRQTATTRDLPPHAPEPVVTVEVAGLPIEITELAVPTTPRDFPIYGIPAYKPLDLTTPRPAPLPPDARLWQFDHLFGATGPTGQILCTWHPCRWRLAAAPRPGQPTTETLFARLARQPQWMGAEAAYWQRLGLATGPATCWLVGGTLSRDLLAALALSLL